MFRALLNGGKIIEFKVCTHLGRLLPLNDMPSSLAKRRQQTNLNDLFIPLRIMIVGKINVLLTVNVMHCPMLYF